MTTRMNLRVLTVFAIVALPLLAVAAVLTVGAGRSDLRDSSGRRLTQLAELLSSATDVFVHRRIIDATVLSRVPTVRETAAAASLVAFDQAKTNALDQAWQRGRALPPDADGLLTNAAAQFLAAVARVDPIYREVLLTDRYGRLAAASERTTDYFQADEEWWNESFGDGVRGRVFVTGAIYDESAQSHAIQIAVPIVDSTNTSVVGVLKVIADIRELAAAVTGARLGETGEAQLVRPDGSLVLGGMRGVGSSQDYFAAEALRQRLSALGQGQGLLFQLHFRAPAISGESRVVGVAPSQLGASYPNLNWLVAVSQDERELFGPSDAQSTWLLLVLAVAALTMFVLAVMFSSWLAASPIADDIHLSTHPAVHRTDGVAV